MDASGPELENYRGEEGLGGEKQDSSNGKEN